MLFNKLATASRYVCSFLCIINCDCKHYGCGPKDDTHPVYLEMKSELIYESVALSFPPISCFVVNLLCSAFNLKKIAMNKAI